MPLTATTAPKPLSYGDAWSGWRRRPCVGRWPEKHMHIKSKKSATQKARYFLNFGWFLFFLDLRGFWGEGTFWFFVSLEGGMFFFTGRSLLSVAILSRLLFGWWQMQFIQVSAESKDPESKNHHWVKSNRNFTDGNLNVNLCVCVFNMKVVHKLRPLHLWQPIPRSCRKKAVDDPGTAYISLIT